MACGEAKEGCGGYRGEGALSWGPGRLESGWLDGGCGGTDAAAKKVALRVCRLQEGEGCEMGKRAGLGSAVFFSPQGRHVSTLFLFG